jgi:MFS family permease
MPMTRTQLALSNVGCLVTLLLSLLDTNIVGAVTYPMVRDLDPVHGVAHLPWLVIGYTLADCVVLPIYGKLADAYGAKRIYLVALSVFIVGSALCGLSTNLTELIAFRTLQGFGGGGLIATTMVILGLLQRGTDQATGKQGTMRTSMGGVMVGVGMALGPTVGGIVAQHLGWRWAFYLNLPLACVALVIACTALRLPPVTSTRHRLDLIGATLIAAAATALLLVTEWGGKQYSWRSPVIIGLLVVGLVLLAAFLRRQATATEPIIPLAMAAGFLAAAVVSRAILARWGKYRHLLVLGNATTTIAMAVFALTTGSGIWALWLGVSLFLLGFGLGQNIGIGVTYAQNSVDVEHIGSATTALPLAATTRPATAGRGVRCRADRRDHEPVAQRAAHRCGGRRQQRRPTRHRDLQQAPGRSAARRRAGVHLLRWHAVPDQRGHHARPVGAVAVRHRAASTLFAHASTVCLIGRDTKSKME